MVTLHHGSMITPRLQQPKGIFRVPCVCSRHKLYLLVVSDISLLMHGLNNMKRM